MGRLVSSRSCEKNCVVLCNRFLQTHAGNMPKVNYKQTHGLIKLHSHVLTSVPIASVGLLHIMFVFLVQQFLQHVSTTCCCQELLRIASSSFASVWQPTCDWSFLDDRLHVFCTARMISILSPPLKNVVHLIRIRFDRQT